MSFLESAYEFAVRALGPIDPMSIARFTWRRLDGTPQTEDPGVQELMRWSESAQHSLSADAHEIAHITSLPEGCGDIKVCAYVSYIFLYAMTLDDPISGACHDSIIIRSAHLPPWYCSLGTDSMVASLSFLVALHGQLSDADAKSRVGFVAQAVLHRLSMLIEGEPANEVLSWITEREKTPLYRDFWSEHERTDGDRTRG